MSRMGESQPVDAPEQPGHIDTEATPPSFSDFAGVVWVPDPEQRHGWREYYIRHPQAKPSRPMGFRKPGER